MNLKMRISNVKSIKHLVFDFPLEKGLYAITGENACGKSTLVACASSVFFNMPMYEYFGKPEIDSLIEFELDGAIRSWSYQNKKWVQKSTKKMKLNGFYEGSIIFGNRFRDTKISIIQRLDDVTDCDLNSADEFVRENLGKILHDDKNYYKELFLLNKDVAKEKKLGSMPYFYKLPTGKYISQARMSTGENLLISILNSLNIVRNKRIHHNHGWPCAVFLDEIELALHASALRRLVYFLTQISDECDLAIFFSTHSLELIRGIRAQNIYYLDRRVDDTISVTNPCYPAYATRNLYSDDGYGDDMIIFVEDDLAKILVERILFEKELRKNIRIKVLATGGWTNTIMMAYDVISAGLLLKNTKLAIVLDKDIKGLVPDFMHAHKQYKYLKPDYLPISSLEKYLKQNLINNVDEQLYEKLDNYIFQKKPLSAILKSYAAEHNVEDDKDGKTLYGILLNEIRSIKKDRENLVEIVVKHLMEYNKELVDTLSAYLEKKIL